MNENELDRRLDERLRAAFAPPPDEAFAAAAARVVPRPAPRPFWPWLLAAAALLLVGILLWERPRRGPEGHDGEQLGALWAAAYEDAVARGFEGGRGMGMGMGMGCCEPGFDLGASCQQRFAKRLELHGAGGLQLVGGYSGLSTGGCMAMLARHGGAPVCVCVVRAEQDPRVELPAGSSLHLARRELDGLVL